MAPELKIAQEHGGCGTGDCGCDSGKGGCGCGGKEHEAVVVQAEVKPEILTAEKLEQITGSKLTTTYTGDLPHQTQSLCPECTRILPSLVFAEDNKVWIQRECPEHGEIKEVYWEDLEMYNKAKGFGTKPKNLENPNMRLLPNLGANCPTDCGLCRRHKSHTALGNLVVTNRCDLSCWYCFFYAKEGEPIYEPSMQLLKNMLLDYRNERPVPTNAIQITGGEPSIREDIVEVVKMAKGIGFDHIQFNTNGITIAREPEMAVKLHDAGANVIYMSFDGVSPRTNPKNHWEAPYALDAFRKGKQHVVLVPTVIRSVNDHEVGKIINFGLNNLDIVKAVNFQPVSLVGRMPAKVRERQRITIPGTIRAIEEQTDGAIAREDWFTVPCVSRITHFIEAMTKKAQYDLTIHFACGMGAYVYLDRENKKVIPITRFADVEGLTEYLDVLAEEIAAGKMTKVGAGARVLFKLNSFTDKKNMPKDFNFGNLLWKMLIKHDYSAVGSLQTKMMFIGMMHFMDKYNYDIERVERCDIHYVMPDGRILPFCTFNVIPEIYRDKVQSQYSSSVADWSKRYPNFKYDGDKYHRDIKALTNGEPYQKHYVKQVDYFKV